MNAGTGCGLLVALRGLRIKYEVKEETGETTKKVKEKLIMALRVPFVI